MEKLDYRVRAVLARVRSTLDRFSLRLEVDWNYDVRKVLEEILALAVGELEFGKDFLGPADPKGRHVGQQGACCLAAGPRGCRPCRFQQAGLARVEVLAGDLPQVEQSA